METKYEKLARLVERAKLGEEEAFAQLFYTFSKSVYYIGLRITKNEEDANDIIQETMIDLHKNLHTINNPQALVAYVNRVANNRCIDFLRKNNRLQQIDTDADEILQNVHEDDADSIPEEYLTRKDLRSVMVGLIDELHDGQRTVILFYYYKHLSIKEISELLEIDETAVGMRLSRARATLKQKLEATGKGSLMSVTLLPIFSQVLEANATDVYTQEISAFNWQRIAECIGFPAATVSATKHAAITGKKVAAPVKAASTAIRTAGSVVVTTAVTLITALAITAGLWMGGVFNSEPGQKVLPLSTQSNIIFTGGDKIEETVNPKHATVKAENERGELIARYWQITPQGSEKVLHTGQGNKVDNELVIMYEQSEFGKYTLWFFMEDAEGVTYAIEREFTIRQ